MWVDANHAYDAVAKDISDWWKLVRSGGILGGSSFVGDVQRAVTEFAKKHGLGVTLLENNYWYISKS